jgi:hypothetical protein
LPQGKGRIVLDQTTEVSDWPGVWAIGDCAAIKQVDGNISPPTAQHALRQAKTCAENMCHRAHFWLANCKIMNTTEIRHQKPRVLTFKDHWPPKSVIVVGQKSKWNSPFRCPKDGSPEEVLEKYRRHLVTAKLLRHLHELRGKNLVCCCSEKSRAPAMLSFCLRWLIANGFLANVRRKRVSSAREDET